LFWLSLQSKPGRCGSAKRPAEDDFGFTFVQMGKVVLPNGLQRLISGFMID
jgi:hypothetical protein